MNMPRILAEAYRRLRKIR